jgi:hypothetical protein
MISLTIDEIGDLLFCGVYHYLYWYLKNLETKVVAVDLTKIENGFSKFEKSINQLIATVENNLLDGKNLDDQIKLVKDELINFDKFLYSIGFHINPIFTQIDHTVI